MTVATGRGVHDALDRPLRIRRPQPPAHGSVSRRLAIRPRSDRVCKSPGCAYAEAAVEAAAAPAPSPSGMPEAANAVSGTARDAALTNDLREIPLAEGR